MKKAQLASSRKLTSTVNTLLLLGLMSGCSLLSTESSKQLDISHLPKDVQTRIKQVEQIKHWSVQGKVAFLEKSKKQSASFRWLINLNDHSQKLDLNTYLGINILQLNSTENHHVLKVGEHTYQGSNLSQMLQELADINLPTQALSYWLKGMPYLASDKVSYHQTNNLPENLVSYVDGQKWQIFYQQHQSIKVKSEKLASPADSSQEQMLTLARKITIKQDDLTIKLMINKWNLL